MEQMEEVIASKSRRSDQRPPRITKRSVMVDLLRRQSGATVDDICARTGWKPQAVIGYIQFIRWVTENGIAKLEKRTNRNGVNVYRAA